MYPLAFARKSFLFIYRGIHKEYPHLGGERASRDVASVNFGGCPKLPYETFLSVTFISNNSSPMVLCPVNWPSKVHFTSIFALRNGKIFEVWG